MDSVVMDKMNDSRLINISAFIMRTLYTGSDPVRLAKVKVIQCCCLVAFILRDHAPVRSC